MEKEKNSALLKRMQAINNNIQNLFLEYLECTKDLAKSNDRSSLEALEKEQNEIIWESIKTNQNVLIRKYYKQINGEILKAVSDYKNDLLCSPEILEQTIRIAYFGTGTSNTYLSLIKMLQKSGFKTIDKFVLYKNQIEIDLVGTTSINDLEQKLVLGEVDYAFLPYVNSNTGVILDTYNLMRNVRFKFESIFTDSIVLYLYVAKRNVKKIKSYYDIETIYTNIPALNQCSEFVVTYTPFATYRKAISTTQSIDCVINDKKHLAACFANISADSNCKIVRYRDKTTSNNNGTYTKYLLISIPKNNHLMKKQTNIEDYFVGYYLYVSERKEGKKHSVDAKSYRAVSITKDHDNHLNMSIYTFGNKTNKISHSTSVRVYFDDSTKDIVLEYDYIGENALSAVCGKAFLRGKESVIRNPNKRIYGTYEGLNNGKSGNLEYRRISKKEFELLTEGNI